MLSALALGARELAGLPSLDTSAVAKKAAQTAAFPSKALPGKLHRQLAPPSAPQIDRITASLTASALSDTRAEIEDTVPEAARHKLLTVRRSVALAPKTNGMARKDDYAALAGDHFLMPLINRFWLYLRDLATAPRAAATSSPLGGGPASAILLDPLVLTKFLGTLAILLDAARLSASFLAVLAPEALELLLALRSSSHESAVTAASLEATLVVLDGSVRLDGGRTLAQRFPTVLGQVQSMAEEAWRNGEASDGVGRVGRAAAGVLLRIDQVYERFRSARLSA
jgi:telomere length regulation protein